MGVAISVTWFHVLAQINAVPVRTTSFFSWAYELLGPGTSLVILLAGLVVFLAACVAVTKSRRPSVIAAYLTLLPLPVLLGIFLALGPQISSLAVFSLPAQPAPSSSQTAAGVAGALLPIYLALMVSWPSYLVLAIGLIVRTVQSGKLHGRPLP